MQYEFINIPLFENEHETERLNCFLRAHKVVKVERELVRSEDSAFWSFCIEYIQGTASTTTSTSTVQDKSGKNNKKDYRSILDEKHFKIFTKLREYRRTLSQRSSVPAYAVFTDAELAAISELDPINEQTMKKIEGIGEKRMEKYGLPLLGLIDEAARTSD